MDSKATRREDSQQMNYENINKAVDLISPKTKNQTSNVLRQHLDDMSVLKNASAGMAVRGVLVNHSNIENTNKTVIDIVGEICMKGCEMKNFENDRIFTTKQELDEYHHSLKTFAARGETSLKAASFLDMGMSYSYLTDKSEKSHFKAEKVFHSRVRRALVPVKSCELKLENFIFVPDVLKHLKDIETLSLSGKDFDTIHSSFVKFFKNYGSHVNFGIMHFGGIYEWTAKYESKHKSKETFSADIVNHVLQAYISGGNSSLIQHVGGTISGDVIKQKTNFSENYDKSDLSKVVCSVSIYGGPPEADTFSEWKSGLTSENSTWNIIDSDELIEIWKILSNHCRDFRDFSRFSLLMELSFHIEFDFESSIGEIKQSRFQTILLIIQHHIRSICQNFKDTDYITGLMDMQYMQNLFSHIIFITQSSTDERFVSEIKGLMEEIVIYMNNLDNPVKNSIVSWIGDPTQTNTSGMLAAENIQHVESLYSALTTKFRPFIMTQHKKRNEKELNEYIKKELTVVFLRLLSSLKEENKYHYALLLSQLQILTYDVKTGSFPDSLGLKDLMLFTNDLESSMGKYRIHHSQIDCVNDQAFVISVIISKMKKYSVRSKEVVFEKCLDPIKPNLNPKINEILMLCTTNSPYNWSLLENSIEAIIKGDEFKPYMIPIPEIPGNEQMNQTGFYNKLYKLPKRTKSVLEKLGLVQYFPKKIDFADVISFSSKTSDEFSVCALPMMVLRDIMMVNREARDQHLLNNLQKFKKIIQQKEEEQKTDEEQEAMDDEIEKEVEEENINPLDMLVAIFYCSSYTLHQVLAYKLFNCCIAIPFVFPPNVNKDLLLLLGTLRGIIVDMKSEHCMYKQNAAEIPCHVLSFIRLGTPTFSKSSTINKFMSSVDNIFYNEGCPLGNTPHELSNGLIELSLFPWSTTKFMFALNLRGDGFELENSVRVLSEISSVVVVCLQASHLTLSLTLDRLNIINERSKAVVLAIDGSMFDWEEMNNLHKRYKNALSSDNRKKTFMVNIKVKNRIKDMSTIKISFRTKVSTLIKNQPDTNMVDRIRGLNGLESLFVDEDCFDVNEKQNALFVLSKLPHDCEDIKHTVLPIQTTILPDVSAIFKKKHDSSDIIALKEDANLQDLLQLREKQLQTMRTLHPFMQTFISNLLQYKDRLEQLSIFLVWMKAYLDNRCMGNVLLQNIKSPDVSSEGCVLYSRGSDSSFGLEHVMREVAQIFESCSALKSQLSEQNTWTRVSQFPVIAAQFLLKGQPVEVMYGDTGYVPLEWIKAIFEALGKALSDKKCLVLSIIGIQSTGKSTLLNTMFGLTFPVGAGRCTEGVFMQIVPVSRDDFQYILVLDTEGLRAQTRGNDMTKFDNEIATFAIGLAHINIINIKGESTTQMKEIIPMALCSLLRLKLGNSKINLHQTCLFVHQNVSAKDARQKTEQERNILTSEIDAMTSAAAEHLNNYEIKKISDVINFDPHENVFFIPDLWVEDDQMKHINIGYSLSVGKLKEKIMQFATVDKPYLSFSNLTLKIQDLWTGILEHSFVFDFSDSLSLKAYDEMIKQFQELKYKLHRLGQEQLTHIENVLFGTNSDFTENAEILRSELEKIMNTEKTENMKIFNEFIDNSNLISEMKQWRKIMTEKLEIEQEKINWTLQKDFMKLVLRVERKREQSLRQTEFEEELMLMVRNLDEKERTNEELLREKFDVHWTLWSKKLIPDLQTSLPNLTKMMHDLVNQTCTDNIKAYVNKYMSKSENEEFKKLNSLVGSLSYKDFDTSVINIKRYYSMFGQIKYFETDCKEDVLVLIKTIFGKIDTYLKTKSYSVSQFENRFAMDSFSIISKNINSFKSEKCTLSPKFHAMILSHVAKYLIIYFTRVHMKEEEKQKQFRKQQVELMQQFMSNITESDKAAIYFLKALAVGIEEHVCTKISGKVADFIVKEFGHSKQEVIKAILLDLARKDQFHLFKMYIDEPRDYASFWTTWYTNCKIFAIQEGTTLTLYSKFAKALLLEVTEPLRTGIIKAKKSCSKSLQNSSSWISTFTQEIMKSRVYPLKPENLQFIQKHVLDFETFSTALLKNFDKIEKSIFNVFAQTTADTIEWKDCPYNKIIDELWGCDAKCPFCSETCIHSNKNHLELGEKHRCLMHRPQGIGDTKVTETYLFFLKKEVLEVENCNSLIGTSKMYRKPGSTEWRKFSDFRKDYENWEIRDDKHTRSLYWMWVFCEYGHEMEIINNGVKLPDIPANRKVNKDIAIESLVINKIS